MAVRYLRADPDTVCCKCGKVEGVAFRTSVAVLVPLDGVPGDAVVTIALEVFVKSIVSGAAIELDDEPKRYVFGSLLDVAIEFIGPGVVCWCMAKGHDEGIATLVGYRGTLATEAADFAAEVKMLGLEFAGILAIGPEAD